MDLPHYHGVGLTPAEPALAGTSRDDAAAKEVHGA